MAYEDDFAACVLPQHMEVFGSTVTYRPIDGSGDVSLTAAVMPEGMVEEDEEAGRAASRTLSVVVATDPTASYGGVADPQIDDQVIVNSELWHVESVTVKIAGFSALDLARPESIERSHRGYRLEK